MQQQNSTPDDLLKPYVKEIWVFDGDSCENPYYSFKFFADGCPGLFFHRSPGMSLHPGNKKVAHLFLYGQTVKPIELTVAGPFQVIIFQFYPHVIKSLYGINANELTDTCIDVNLLQAGGDISLIDQLLNTTLVDKQVEIIAAHMKRLIQRNNVEIDSVMHFAIWHMLQSNGRISLRELHRNLKISERTFERRFEQYVGISPRLFARICSFHGALNQLKSNTYQRLSDIAFDNGYADQSHFIRTFKEFTGFSPLKFQKFSNELVNNPALVRI